MTLIASHRGGALEVPENSPTAFRHTAALPVDQVEFDIHPTRDGAIVVFHDATLERTSNGSGEVAGHTLAELKALVLNGTDREAMLTLEELVAIFAPTDITLRMEVKTDARHAPYPGLLAQALDVLDAQGMRGRTVVTSFNLNVAAAAGATAGLAGAIWLVSPERQAQIGIDGIVDAARGRGIGQVGIRCSHLDGDILATLRAGGLRVGAWAVNDSLAIADMLALDVDVFTTDRPSRALLLRDGVVPRVGRDEVTSLTPVSVATREGFIALPNTRSAHTAAHAEVAAFGQVETGGAALPAGTEPSLRLAAWNVERCLYPEATAAMLARHGVSIALLTEVDNGCHRTGQRHTMRDVATGLGQRYAYAVEFLELATMRQPIALADTSPGNALGFHGNGFTSALPFRDPVVIRLNEVADWYAAPRGGQKRIGTRMAVAATFDLAGCAFVACSVHLESDADAPGRALQFRTLLDALDDYAGSRPVVIGGDLNTRVHGPDETLFAMARARGYDWDACNAGGRTTRPSVWGAGASDFTLDWICTRDFEASAPRIVPSVDADGTVLSDHDLLLVTLTPKRGV